MPSERVSFEAEHNIKSQKNFVKQKNNVKLKNKIVESQKQFFKKQLWAYAFGASISYIVVVYLGTYDISLQRNDRQGTDY